LWKYFREQMDVMAEQKGIGDRWTKAREAFKTYKETFDKPGSPVKRAVEARTPADGAQPFLKRGVLEDDEAIKNLGVYDPAMVPRLKKLREASQAPKPKAPRALGAGDKPKIDAGPELKSSKEPPAGPEVKLPERKPGEFDVVEAKRESIRQSKRLSRVSPSELFFLLGSPIAFTLNGHTFGALLGDAAYIMAKKVIASQLDHPKVIEWLSKPNAKDLAQLDRLPPEARAIARAKLRDFIDQENRKAGKRIKVSPQVTAWLGMEAVGNQAEQRAREAARRLAAPTPGALPAGAP
jgi:hypothetical protein